MPFTSFWLNIGRMTVYITPNKSKNTICQIEKYKDILLGCTMNSDICWSQGPRQTLCPTIRPDRVLQTAHLGLKRPAYKVHPPPTDKAKKKKKSHLKYCSKKKKSHLKYCRQFAFEERLLFCYFLKDLGRAWILLWGGEQLGFSGNQPSPSLTVIKILCKWKYCPSQMNENVFLFLSMRTNIGPRSLCPQHLSSDLS